MRPARQPCSYERGFVGRVIVHNDVDVEIGRKVGIDLLEEVEKLDRAMPLVAFADDEAGSDIECREQRGRAAADLGVGLTLGHAGHHRQDGLLAVKRLNLALLVNAEHQSPIRWRQVETDDDAYLVDEQRIARQLERFGAMRL